MEKRCTKCGQVKPFSEFCKNRRRKGGLSSHCKACRRAYYTPRPAVLPLGPNDVKRCTKCGETKPVSEFIADSRYRLGYMSHCRECGRKMRRSWYARNKEHARQYRQKHAARDKRLHKRWRQDNIEKCRGYTRRWFRTLKGRAYARHKQHQRHALQKRSDVTAEWLLKLESRQSTCAYCGRPFSSVLRPTIDHVMPLSKGGTHTKKNIVLCCQSCNSEKGNRWVPIDISCTSGLSCQLLLGFLLES